MNREQHRRDLLGVGRMYLFIMLFFFLINFLTLKIIYEIEGFLFWFNLTCFIGTMLFICWLDSNKYKIIEGRI